MPKVQDGKVSLNLKVPAEVYDKWVSKAAELKILNISEFIRQMVNSSIDNLKEAR